MHFYARCLFIALLLPACFARAQSNTPADAVLSNLKKQAKDAPVEKVYLHTNKAWYGAGDTIWFKGYTVLGGKHRPSLLSNVLYVQLINKSNAIISNIKLPVKQGSTYGDIALPDTLEQGNYHLRAYTAWMRNAGPDYFFDKAILITNSVTNNVFAAYTPVYSLQNGKEILDIAVTYADINGVPYAGKNADYALQITPQKWLKGKGITDSNGSLHISATAIETAPPGKLLLKTTIKTSDKDAATQTGLIAARNAKADVQFFPEGGTMVDGLTSKIAFKAVGNDGLGATVTGSIIDDKDKEVATFSSNNLGMGVFKLNPQSGKTYRAKVNFSNEAPLLINLPTALDKGYVMAFDNTDSLKITVKVNAVGSEYQTGKFTLVAQAGGEVFLEGKGVAGKKGLIATILKSKLPTGIVQFTLISATGEPLNERLMFIQHPGKVILSINTAQKTYTPRQMVSLNLQSRNEFNEPLPGNFSVAVTDESLVPVDEDAENTILTNLLLTSDLKGYIEKPNSYFNSNNPNGNTSLDALLLTQGYHRFEWKQIAAGANTVVNYQPEKNLTISGTLRAENGTPIKKTRLAILNNTARFFAADTVTDNRGRFVFDVPADSLNFTLKTKIAEGADEVHIKLDDNDPPPVNNYAEIPTTIATPHLRPFLLASKKNYDQQSKFGPGANGILLKEVAIKTTMKAERQLVIARAVEFSGNLNGKGVADQVLTYDEFEGQGCTSVSECFQSRLHGVQFDNSTGTPFLTVASYQTNGRKPMAIIIDGMYIDTSARLNEMVIPSEISSIEVLKSSSTTSIYGARGANGVLVITTRHGNGFIEGHKGGSAYVKPKGFYKAREFYMPVYDRLNVKPVTDTRTAVYWKPLVTTDDNGNAVIPYFNADNKGSYRVVVEGITGDGEPVHQVYRYKVE
jgi:TonB-dependent SusC/RagA subfamily outer membrane receptor